MGGDVVAGVVTAALSPLAMTIGFILWGEAWQSSAYALNLFKCTFAGMIFLFVAFSIRSSIPVTASDQSMIMLSSVLGIVVGDNTWLLALQLIGAKRVIVIDTLKPFLAAVLGSLVLHEPFTVAMACGIVISSVGIVLVSLEKDADTRSSSEEGKDDPFELSTHSSHNSQSTFSIAELEVDKDDDAVEEQVSTSKLLLGYVLAAINVVLDAVGSVLTKQYGTELNTWEINFLRFGFAAIMMTAIAILAYLFDVFVWKRAASSASTASKHQLAAKYRVLNPLTDFDSSSHQDMHSIELTGNNSSTHQDAEDPLPDRAVNQFEAKFRSQAEHNSNSPNSNKKPKEDHVWYIFPTFDSMSVEQWSKVIVGVLFVTFTCPALANYALFQIPLGLCLTLTSLGPVYSIPLVYFMSGEKTGTQGMLGAGLAVLGVAIMFSTS